MGVGALEKVAEKILGSWAGTFCCTCATTSTMPRMNTAYLQQPPPTWPKAGAGKPGSFVNRVSHDELVDLYNRRITTRALALRYGVSEKWCSSLFTGKRPLEQKQVKRLARAEMRQFYAALVLKGTSVADAADLACCSYSTMRRIVLGLTGTTKLEDVK